MDESFLKSFLKSYFMHGTLPPLPQKPVQYKALIKAELLGIKAAGEQVTARTAVDRVCDKNGWDKFGLESERLSSAARKAAEEIGYSLIEDKTRRVPNALSSKLRQFIREISKEASKKTLQKIAREFCLQEKMPFPEGKAALIFMSAVRHAAKKVQYPYLPSYEKDRVRYVLNGLKEPHTAEEVADFVTSYDGEERNEAEKQSLIECVVTVAREKNIKLLPSKKQRVIVQGSTYSKVLKVILAAQEADEHNLSSAQLAERVMRNEGISVISMKDWKELVSRISDVAKDKDYILGECLTQDEAISQVLSEAKTKAHVLSEEEVSKRVLRLLIRPMPEEHRAGFLKRIRKIARQQNYIFLDPINEAVNRVIALASEQQEPPLSLIEIGERVCCVRKMWITQKAEAIQLLRKIARQAVRQGYTPSDKIRRYYAFRADHFRFGIRAQQLSANDLLHIARFADYIARTSFPNSLIMAGVSLDQAVYIRHVRLTYDCRFALQRIGLLECNNGQWAFTELFARLWKQGNLLGWSKQYLEAYRQSRKAEFDEIAKQILARDDRERQLYLAHVVESYRVPNRAKLVAKSL